MAVVSDEQVDVTVVVVVAGTDALSPAFAGDAGLLGDVGKRAVVVVSIQVTHGRGVGGGKRSPCAVDKKDVRPPVVVVVDDRDAAACRLQDELLGAFPTDNRACVETGCGREVTEVREWIGYGRRLKRRQESQRESGTKEELHEFVGEDRLAKR